MAPPLSLPPAGALVVGPFLLERPIGQGGMADVWLGAHRTQHQQVAVKVLTGKRAREEQFIRALRNEIHNVAQLHHPGIILLFDTGEVDAAAEAASDGRLVAGSPWFAMELASHGALSTRRFPLPWSRARMLLLSLLDALAHAHARGVVHRDLKPGNILVCAPGDPRPGLKLTDFGIAQPIGDHIDGEAESGHLSGTPRYMAPEQFEARWRDFGPWTDLYALGCLAYQLATGKPPFSGNAARLAVAHCQQRPAPPSPVHEGFPPDFASWVLRLLEKDPQRRFVCAADAAWALLRLRDSGLEHEDTAVAGWEQALRSREALQSLGVSDITAAITESSSRVGHKSIGDIGDIGDLDDNDGNDDVDESDDVDDIGDIEAQRARRSAEARTGVGAAGVREAAEHEGRGRSAEHAPDVTQPPTLLDRQRGAVSGPPTVSGLVSRGAPMRGRMTLGGRPVMASQPSEDLSATQVRPHAAPGSMRSDGAVPSGAAILTDDDDRNHPLIPPEPTRDSPRHKRPGAAGAPVIADGGARRRDGARGEITPSGDASWTDLRALRARVHLDEEVTLSARSNSVPLAQRGGEPGVQLVAAAPPPFPPTWRRPGPQAPAQHLLGAGLQLYGLRQIPLVDRVPERDHLWSTLRAVHDGKGMRVVVVRGPAGIGKTRLAQWFVERAVEVGAAVGMRARHGPGGGPLDGLAGLVGLHARTLGLGRRNLKRRLVEVVHRQGVHDIDEALALAELLQPSGGVSAPARTSHEGDVLARHEEMRESEQVLFGSAGERFAVVARYLRRVAAERPVIAWFDDVQWGLDAIAFAQHLLQDERAGTERILLVLSASDEALGERPVESAAVEELVQHPGTVELRLAHLPDADHRALVGELLGLEPGLAGMVAARTAGNPLFAVQLVGDFVARGVLELGPHGFALRPGERAVFPDTLHDAWSERVARVLKRAPAGSRRALELGAVLGSAGEDEEWRAICDEAGTQLAPALIDELLLSRLVVLGDAGLCFGHAMVRESVLRAAAEEGRLEDHHRSAARMLQKRYGERRGVAERIGRHLAAAQELLEALPHFLRAAVDASRASGSSMAHALLGERDALVDRIGLPEDDPRRVEGWVLKAELLLDEGRADEATLWTGLVLRHRHDLRHAQACGHALKVEALVAHKRARWDEAKRALYEARRLAEQCGDKELLTACISSLADVAYSRGRLDDSGALYSHALQSCLERADEVGMAAALWNLSYVSLWRGEDQVARDQLQRQQRFARRTGHRSMIGNGRNALGDIERFSGNYDAAEARYDDALRLFEAIGAAKRHTVRVNMAMNALGRGHLDRARERVRAVFPDVERVDPALSALCHGVMAAVAAHDERWDAFDEHFRVIASSRPEQDLIDADGAWLFEIIGDHARAQEQDERAALAYDNAIALWSVLGRQDRIDNVERALSTLGTTPRRRR